MTAPKDTVMAQVHAVFLAANNENIETVSGRYSEYISQVGNTAISHKSLFEWFNTAAFTIPANRTVGNVKRNPPTLKPDALTDDDLTLGKAWPLHDLSTL